MADVDQEMAKIAIRTKTPLVWKRQGNKLTYSYCLTCKKVSMGDPIHFKTRHSDKICKSGWATYQDLFLAKAPVEEAEAEAEAEPVNEIVGSSEIPKDYSVCMEFFKSRNPDFAGTVEQGIFGLLKELERYKKNADNAERQVRTLENSQMSLDYYREEHKKQYEYYSNTIEQQSQKIRSIEKESGIEQAKQEYYKEKKEYQEKVEDMRREEERLRDAWGRLKTERDTAVKDLEQAKKKWDSDKKELQQDYDELEDKYKKLRRSQRDSD